MIVSEFRLIQLALRYWRITAGFVIVCLITATAVTMTARPYVAPVAPPIVEASPAVDPCPIGYRLSRDVDDVLAGRLQHVCERQR